MVAREGTPCDVCLPVRSGSALASTSTARSLATNRKMRNSRLKLAQLTAKTLKLGLDTLGIETVDVM
ncbi:DALR anticodon-binding domain-containing protein [Escherichia coli]